MLELYLGVSLTSRPTPKTSVHHNHLLPSRFVVIYKKSVIVPEALLGTKRNRRCAAGAGGARWSHFEVGFPVEECEKG